MTKGEFICVIGDVGAGKTSLLKAIVGDLIYISDSEIEAQGGLSTVLDEAQLEEWKKTLLSPEFLAEQEDKPIFIAGTTSFVE